MKAKFVHRSVNAHATRSARYMRTREKPEPWSRLKHPKEEASQREASQEEASQEEASQEEASQRGSAQPFAVGFRFPVPVLAGLSFGLRARSPRMRSSHISAAAARTT